MGTDLAKDATQTADAAMTAVIVQGTSEAGQNDGNDSTQEAGQIAPAVSPTSPPNSGRSGSNRNSGCSHA